MGDALKVLVVGGGSAGVRHFRYLREYGARCSLCDPADSCRVTREFPDAEHVCDFDEADLASFDGVVLCTPPIMHVPQAIAAARAGCHILSEKPLSVLSEDGLDELEAIVREKGLVAAVAFPYANMKAMDRVIEIVGAGEIGRIWSIQVHSGQNLLKYRPDYFDTYYGVDAEGGGALQDVAVHALMGLEMLLGPELEVTCQRHNVGIKREGVTADETAWLWLRYPAGVVATIDFSFQCHWHHYEWIIGGSAGAMKLLVEEAVIYVFDAKTERTREESFDDSWNETFRANAQNWADAIRGEAALRCTLEMARTNLRAVLAARRSASCGRPVLLEST